MSPFQLALQISQKNKEKQTDDGEKSLRFNPFRQSGWKGYSSTNTQKGNNVQKITHTIDRCRW